LVLGISLALLFSSVPVAYAADSQFIVYSIYSSCGSQTTYDNFVVYADGVWEPGSSVNNVTFQVWTKDKSDIKSYTGTQSDSNWRVQVNTVNFNGYRGTYHIDVYATDVLGKTGKIGGTSVYVVPDGTIASTASSLDASASSSGTSGTTFKVTATGVSNEQSDVAGVNFKAYCSNNEEDVAWYSGTKLSNGNWRATINIANHMNHRGEYKIAIFTVNSVGAQSYVGTVFKTVN
jgi:hypothetical protein